MPAKQFSLLIFLLISAAPVAFAQDTEQAPDVSAQIESMRAATDIERKILIMKEMNMTETEAEQFWPLYEEYRGKMKQVGDIRVRIITDYAASYSTMTDELAEELLDDYVDYMDEKQSLTKKYIKKFRAILPDIKVTRYFQLEHKLDAVVDYQLAGRIPLVE
jgi:hypothetical protein